MIHAVLLTSLSHDPVIELYSTRSGAEKRMKAVLLKEAWPEHAAAEAASKGSEVVLNDDGNDETICIRDLEIKD